MENRPLSLAAGLIVYALLSTPLHAAEGGASADQEADWARRMEQAAALQSEGKARRNEAAKILDEKNIACRSKFQVNACLKESDSEYTVVARQAKRLENEGLAIERAVRKEQLSVRDAQHQVDAVRHEEELPTREAETAAARHEAEVREAEIRASKAGKAAEGVKRKAADEEKLRQRQAAHNARVAEKMQKAQQRAAEAGTTGK